MTDSFVDPKTERLLGVVISWIFQSSGGAFVLPFVFVFVFRSANQVEEEVAVFVFVFAFDFMCVQVKVGVHPE